MKKVLTIKMLLLAAATLAITLGPDPADASARRAIRLRVNDAVAEPGGLVAVVVRTYAPRPISQGQISVRTKRKGRTRRVAQDAAEAAVRMPLTLENYKVFSRRDDAKVSVRVETQGNSQNVILQFSSKSGTINRADGPLAVLYFRLAPNVKPRQEFELTINADQTFVVNPNGKPIRFEPKPGVLRVRGPGAHHRLEIEGDTVRAGDLARLELQTFEPVAMSQGHLEVKYDPSIATGAPKVAMNEKYGRRDFSVDVSTPGLIKVDFRSKDASWNLVPGAILAIDLPTAPGVKRGTRSPITIDGSATQLFDGNGAPLVYSFKDDTVRFKSSDSSPGDFEDGVASADAGAGTITLNDGTVITVDATTAWDNRGDLFSLANVVTSLAAGNTVKVEGNGAVQGDGSILAATIKAEDDDGNDANKTKFKDDVASVDQVAATLTLTDGTVVAIGASTAWHHSGDLFNLAAVAASMAAGNTVEVDGRGPLQADGSILASRIRAEIEEDHGNHGGQDKFEDDVASVDQSAGTLTLKDGTVVAVNASTIWENSGDLFSLADVATALAAGKTVEAEGRGKNQADGSILADKIKAEDDDDHGGGNGDKNEFEDNVTSVDPGAGTITLNDGTVVSVDGSTVWDNKGDLLSLTEIATSLTAGNTVKVEGKGAKQADGSVLASKIKAEDDDNGGDGGDGNEFEDKVASVDQAAGTMTLNDGTVVAVNASTVWDNEGDLFSLADIATSLAAGNSVEAEGKGTPQADGSTLATEIKAEDDD